MDMENRAHLKVGNGFREFPSDRKPYSSGLEKSDPIFPVARQILMGRSNPPQLHIIAKPLLVGCQAVRNLVYTVHSFGVGFTEDQMNDFHGTIFGGSKRGRRQT